MMIQMVIHVAFYPLLYGFAYYFCTVGKSTNRRWPHLHDVSAGDTASLVMQQAHAMIGPLMAALALRQIKLLMLEDEDEPYADHKSTLITLTAQWEFGYYSWDLIVGLWKCLVVKRRYCLEDLGFHIHHAIPVFGGCAYFAWRETRVTAATDFVTACILLSNLQSAFYNLTQFAHRAGVPPQSPIYRYSYACFVISCLVLRFGGFLWLLRHFASLHEMPGTIRNGWSLMPTHCRCATATLLLLNLVWLCLVGHNKLLPALRGCIVPLVPYLLSVHH